MSFTADHEPMTCDKPFNKVRLALHSGKLLTGRTQDEKAVDCENRGDVNSKSSPISYME